MAVTGTTGDERPAAWHVLGVEAVADLLATGPEGLSNDEARDRLARYGPNVLEDTPPPSNLKIALHQFQSPLIYVLLVAATVSSALGELLDGGIILAILILNAAIGFVQERHAEKSVHALATLVAPRARVVRGGQEIELPSRDLVPGDLVLLESGNRAPADLRLCAATALRVDESLLTGESVPVDKQTLPLADPATPLAERTNLVFSGTVVASGRGRGYVVATGPASELGAIATRMRREAPPPTPLQVRMERFARGVGGIVLVAAATAFAIGVATGEPAGEMFLVAVALAVSAIPEGLPVAFTITLARGVRHMARRNAIVRRLPAVETLGSTTVIGTDKTGTLTENRMTVQAIWAGGRVYAFNRPAVAADAPLLATLQTGVLTNEASITQEGDGYASQGDPTDAALLVAAERAGIDTAALREHWAPLADIPFEPGRQYSASARVRARDGRVRLFVKGAPERVLPMCDRMLLPGGEAPLDPRIAHTALRDLASQGLRVLAMAAADLPARVTDLEDAGDPHGLTFLGMQGLLDPPRPGVRESIAACRRAGIRVLMITGDHADTALAIGRRIGLNDDGARALTGAEIERLTDDALDRVVPEVNVIARATPEHKLRIVRALQRHGEVVAVTGDGVNDAPALRAAEIGIAMGRSGSDVAREASDIILADDNFVSIQGAVEEGRITFDNIRKATFFLLSSNTAEVLTILAALALGWPLPLLVAQILWLNLATDGVQNIALAFEPGEPGVLDRPPRSRHEGVLSGLLWERLAVSGIVMAAGTLTLFRWELDHGASLAYAQTVALTTLVLYQTFQAGNARSEHRSLLRISPFSNRFLFVAALGALLLHVAALYLPPTQYLLRVEPLDLASWVRIVAVAASLLVAVELHKFIRRRIPPRSSQHGDYHTLRIRSR